jgi:hypothetical protein
VVFGICDGSRFHFTAAKRLSNGKALRKHDARNAQALHLARVSAGRGVPPDRRRSVPEAGGQGKPLAVSPPEALYWLAYLFPRHCANQLFFYTLNLLFVKYLRS